MRICPKCGFRIENDNALFCRKCGTQLPVVEPDTESESTNNAVMPEDAPQYSQDTPQYNQDTPQYGQDAPEYSQTTPPFNQGSTNNQGTTEYGQGSTEYGQGSTEYGPTPRYTVEEGDMKMAEDTGSGISQENGDDNVRFYDEDDPVAVTPPPPPPLYGNEGYGTSGYSQPPRCCASLSSVLWPSSMLRRPTPATHRDYTKRPRRRRAKPTVGPMRQSPLDWYYSSSLRSSFCLPFFLRTTIKTIITKQTTLCITTSIQRASKQVQCRQTNLPQTE